MFFTVSPKPAEPVVVWRVALISGAVRCTLGMSRRRQQHGRGGSERIPFTTSRRFKFCADGNSAARIEVGSVFRFLSLRWCYFRLRLRGWIWEVCRLDTRIIPRCSTMRKTETNFVISGRRLPHALRAFWKPFNWKVYRCFRSNPSLPRLCAEKQSIEPRAREKKVYIFIIKDSVMNYW